MWRRCRSLADGLSQAVDERWIKLWKILNPQLADLYLPGLCNSGRCNRHIFIGENQMPDSLIPPLTCYSHPFTFMRIQHSSQLYNYTSNQTFGVGGKLWRFFVGFFQLSLLRHWYSDSYCPGGRFSRKTTSLPKEALKHFADSDFAAGVDPPAHIWKMNSAWANYWKF